MNIIDVGEKLHIIERRQFDNDVKRHFVGEVIRSDNNIIRLRGHAWVFNGGRVIFEKRPDIRERVLVLGDRLTINVLPREADIEAIEYINTEEGLMVSDRKTFSMDITEFAARR